MRKKDGATRKDAKRLLEINGNKKKSKSIFDRLNLPKNLDVDMMLADDDDSSR